MSRLVAYQAKAHAHPRVYFLARQAPFAIRSVAYRRLPAASVMFMRQVHVSGPQFAGSLDLGGRNGYTTPSQRPHDEYPQTRTEAGFRASEARAWLGLRCSHTRSESSSSQRLRS